MIDCGKLSFSTLLLSSVIGYNTRPFWCSLFIKVFASIDWSGLRIERMSLIINRYG